MGMSPLPKPGGGKHCRPQSISQLSLKLHCPDFNVVFIGAGNIHFGSAEGPWNQSVARTPAPGATFCKTGLLILFFVRSVKSSQYVVFMQRVCLLLIICLQASVRCACTFIWTFVTPSSSEHKLGPRLKIVGLVDPASSRCEDVLAIKRASFVQSAYANTKVRNLPLPTAL